MPILSEPWFLVLAVAVAIGLLISAALGARTPTRVRPRLGRLRYRARKRFTRAPRSKERPYAFASFSTHPQGFVDLTTDGDDALLERWGLPVLRTPADLATWLDVPIGQLAWLVHFDRPKRRPTTEREAHYVFHWMAKRSGGHRLIESPKPLTRAAQVRILDEILHHTPAHDAAHGFVPERSIVTNARPHVGKRVVLKFDLEDFYPNVRFNRVVAIFRGIGYCREAAIWLARLTTSAVPTSLRFPTAGDAGAPERYFAPHLPQGAPTSPALANLSAFSLDVRLRGMATRFGANYTRYADDLTFSGDADFLRSLRVFIPLVQSIVRDERFRANPRKRRVLRDNQRQVVAGVVVNDRPNVRRDEYDRLKAILHNCVVHGPSTQNRESHPDFAAHLRGRIAHVAQLNPRRGAKLLATYRRIDWDR